MILDRRFVEKLRGTGRPFLLAASMWAFICAGYTYDAVQQERQLLHDSYVKNSGSDPAVTMDPHSQDVTSEAEKEKCLQAYRRELRELYWVFAPFFWASITFGGVAVAVGFLLPIHWIHRTSK